MWSRTDWWGGGWSPWLWTRSERSSSEATRDIFDFLTFFPSRNLKASSFFQNEEDNICMKRCTYNTQDDQSKKGSWFWLGLGYAMIVMKLGREKAELTASLIRRKDKKESNLILNWTGSTALVHADDNGEGNGECRCGAAAGVTNAPRRRARMSCRKITHW